MNIFTAGESAPWRLLHMTSRCSQGRRLFWISSMSDSSHLSRNWEQGYGDKKKRVPDDIRKQSPLSGVNPLLDIIFWKTKIFTSLRLCDQIPAGPDCSGSDSAEAGKTVLSTVTFLNRVCVHATAAAGLIRSDLCAAAETLSHHCRDFPVYSEFPWTGELGITESDLRVGNRLHKNTTKKEMWKKVTFPGERVFFWCNYTCQDNPTAPGTLVFAGTLVL